MKLPKIFGILLIAFVCMAPMGPVGCSNATLATGGAYAKVGEKPDKSFFAVDAAYDLAFSAFTTATDFEKKNRQVLWDISPDIKHALDKARPQAKLIAVEYAKARRAYLAVPTAAGLTSLETILGRMQQVASAAQSALPKK